MVQPAYYGMVSSGSAGPDVALVQTWLNGLPKTKWPCIQTLRVDGHFGSGTEQAVKYFQIGVGLTADGKVGASAPGTPWVRPMTPSTEKGKSTRATL